MAKKKDKLQVINNIQELNLEIDYDKLAEAIVKAQNNNVTTDKNESKYTTKTFASLISLSFRSVSIMLLPIIVIIGLAMKHAITEIMLWDNFSIIIANIMCTILVSSIAFVLGIYSAVLWKSAKEIEIEKDKNYIVSVFSGIVSFAALIVALVALFKGVG